MKTSERQMGTRIEDDRPEFYRIIRGNSAKKLRIPPKFMEVLAGDISNSATLGCSYGGRWQVVVRKLLSGTYFEDGLEEFVRDNELGDTEILAFRYDGNMNFHVEVFDKNGIKISAPISEEETRASSEKNGIKRSAPNISDEEETRASSEKIGIKRSGPISDEEETRACSKKIGIKRSAPISNEEETRASSEKNGIKRSAPISDKEEISASSAKRCGVKPGAGETSVSQNFTSKFPHFKRYMFKSCVQGCLLLNIPQSFASTHFPKKNTNVVLRNSEGKTWEVKRICNANRHSLSGGWGAFVRDNNLRLGDTCIFELVEEDVMLVSVF